MSALARARVSLAAATGRARTAVVLPVPWAEPLVGPWRRRHDASAADGMPAHVTILYPFLRSGGVDDDVERELAAALAGSARFSFRLTSVERFPGVVYLAPEPSEPFVEITRALWRLWPECPPYGGAFAEIVPHLTVATGPEPQGIDDLADELPLEGEAESVSLMTRDVRGRWVTRKTFALG